VKRGEKPKFKYPMTWKDWAFDADDINELRITTFYDEKEKVLLYKLCIGFRVGAVDQHDNWINSISIHPCPKRDAKKLYHELIILVAEALKKGGE